MAGIGNFADDYPLIHNPQHIAANILTTIRNNIRHIKERVKIAHRTEKRKLMTELIEARRQERMAKHYV